MGTIILWTITIATFLISVILLMCHIGNGKIQERVKMEMLDIHAAVARLEREVTLINTNLSKYAELSQLNQLSDQLGERFEKIRKDMKELTLSVNNQHTDIQQYKEMIAETVDKQRASFSTKLHNNRKSIEENEKQVEKITQNLDTLSKQVKDIATLVCDISNHLIKDGGAKKPAKPRKKKEDDSNS